MALSLCWSNPGAQRLEGWRRGEGLSALVLLPVVPSSGMFARFCPRTLLFAVIFSPEGDVSVLGSAAKDLLPCQGRFSIESHESSLPTVEAPWSVAWRLRESVSSQEKQIGPLYERQTTLFCWCSFVVGVCVWSARLLFAAWCACPSGGHPTQRNFNLTQKKPRRNGTRLLHCFRLRTWEMWRNCFGFETWCGHTRRSVF